MALVGNTTSESMKPLSILIILLTYCNSLQAQHIWITRNLLNMPLEFRMHKDSIPNIYQIVDGAVYIDGEMHYLRDSLEGIPPHQVYPEDPFSTYLLISPNLSTDVYAILHFVYDKLFEVNIYSNDSYYLTNFYLELKRNFKSKGDIYYTISSDSTVRHSDHITTYGSRYSDFNWSVSSSRAFYHLYHDLINEQGYLSMTDRKIYRRLPATCGFDRSNNSWEKLEAYLIKGNH